MATELLQSTTLDAETLEKLEAEIQSKFLDILNDANFPAILKNHGQHPRVAKFNFRLNKSEAPCNHAAADKAKQLTPLQEEIQTKYLEIINRANFPAVLANFGQKPEILQFQFKLNPPQSELTSATEVSVWNCLGCYCSCWSEEVLGFVKCPC